MPIPAINAPPIMAPTTAPAIAPLLRPELWVAEVPFELLNGAADADEFLELS